MQSGGQDIAHKKYPPAADLKSAAGGLLIFKLQSVKFSVNRKAVNVPVLGKNGTGYYGQIERRDKRACGKIGNRRAKIRINNFCSLYYEAALLLLVFDVLHLEHANKRCKNIEGLGLRVRGFYLDGKRDKV